jgi:pyruvate dehydrogenase E2 component (dihydrolipoamide acetyltransferase)
MFGIHGFTPIINPPQCAILGVGRIEETPTVRNGTIVVRKMMAVSLSFDHRAMDGVTAAKFLVSLAQKSSAPR